MYLNYNNNIDHIISIHFYSFYSNLTTQSHHPLDELEGLQILPDVRSPELPSPSLMSYLGIEGRTKK